MNESKISRFQSLCHYASILQQGFYQENIAEDSEVNSIQKRLNKVYDEIEKELKIN